jgi:UPF0271 protein
MDMQKNFYVLDASAFIGGYIPVNKLNFTIPEVTAEVKDIKSKMILESAINEGKLKIEEPDMESLELIDSTIKLSGDVLRLSLVDKKLLALALSIKKLQGNVTVITDDYTMQNVLKILEIPYKSVLTSGIKQIYAWKRICKGCKKEYSDDYSYDECEICGSPIYKKRIKK